MCDRTSRNIGSHSEAHGCVFLEQDSNSYKNIDFSAGKKLTNVAMGRAASINIELLSNPMVWLYNFE